MKIYLVRHGQCDSNVKQIYNYVNEDLNEKGIEQAKELSKQINNIDYDIVIKHSTDLPISAGFGTSAGFALGISYTLPFLFNVNITHNEAGEIAHIAEVSESTGLGDVISEINGGCVIRLKEGSPIHARIDKIPITKPIYVISKTISSIDTGNIIKNPLHKKRINDSGHNLLNEILKNPCINNFIKLSYKFSRETKLIN